MNLNNQHSELQNRFPSHTLEDNIDIAKILRGLYQHKVVILLASFCTMTLAFLHSLTLQPQYTTSSMLQIKTQSNGNNGILSSLGLNSGQNSSIESELVLLKTRHILEPVIRENSLNISISPHYFPIFGEWVARHHQGVKLAKPFLGLHSYAWGGEEVEIKSFFAPPSEEGKNFWLIAGGNDTYQVYSIEKNLIMTGKVGKRTIAKNNPAISLELTSLKALPGTEFILTFQSPYKMVNSVSNRLKITKLVSELGSGMEDSGIIKLQFSGSNPKEVEHVLNTITNYAASKNLELKSREAQKTLNFLHQRLPDFKKNLEQAENALNQYYSSTGILSASQASQLIIQQLTDLTARLEALKEQKEELLQIYTPRYPEVIATEHRQTQMERKLKELRKKITTLPAAKQVEKNLEREVKIENKLYDALLNDIHQLEIIKAGLVGDIIVLDDATPAAKISKSKLAISSTGFLIGLFLSSTAIILKTLLTKTIEDVDQLENEVQIPVKAIVPFSKKQTMLEKMSKREGGMLNSIAAAPLILAKHDPKDIAIESLQSLRISLYITNLSATHRVIAVMGSLSGIGKSFVSLNLAQVLADSGKRTLLIDADIRKGRLHRALFQPKTSGLSEYLAGEASYEGLVRHIHDNLFFIPCGSHARHPIELLKSPLFHDLIQRTKNEFDQVIVDTAPILPIIDSVLIAPHCDIKLFVVGGSSDQLSDVKQAVKKVRAHGIEIDGIVFNHRKIIARYGSKYHYRYAYGV